MKTKYKVTIEEVVSKDFEVEADTIYEALELVEQGYKNSKIVLTPGELVCKQISANDGKDECVDWYEF